MTPWIVAHQARLSMGFPKQEYWSGLPFPSPWDRLNSGIELVSPALQAESLPTEPPGKSLKHYLRETLFLIEDESLLVLIDLEPHSGCSASLQ